MSIYRAPSYTSFTMAFPIKNFDNCEALYLTD